MGVWYLIEPRTGKREHNWRFAYYVETPSERGDGQWLEALYFRNANRTQFGKLEVLAPNLYGLDSRSIATKMVKDKDYRERYLSDEPDLPRMWKKR
jgi:hypothetical protein